MPMELKGSLATTAGGCLCGAVRFVVRGALRDVVYCHCSKCRRWHGGPAGYTQVPREALELTGRTALKWYRSLQDETPDVYRGFCGECGSNLFWDARGGDAISIAAGALDQPTGLTSLGHIWLEQAGDYYRLCDDLPRHPRGWGSGG